MNTKSFFTAFLVLLGHLCLDAQVVNIPDANLKNALVSTDCADIDGDGYGDTDADANNDGEIQESERIDLGFFLVAFRGGFRCNLFGIKAFKYDSIISRFNTLHL